MDAQFARVELAAADVPSHGADHHAGQHPLLQNAAAPEGVGHIHGQRQPAAAGLACQLLPDAVHLRGLDAVAVEGL